MDFLLQNLVPPSANLSNEQENEFDQVTAMIRLVLLFNLVFTYIVCLIIDFS